MVSVPHAEGEAEYALAAAVAARKLQEVVLQTIIMEEREVAAQLRVEALRLELARQRGASPSSCARLAARRSKLHHRSFCQQMMREDLKRMVRAEEAAASLELQRPPQLVVPAD